MCQEQHNSYEENDSYQLVFLKHLNNHKHPKPYCNVFAVFRIQLLLKRKKNMYLLHRLKNKINIAAYINIIVLDTSNIAQNHYAASYSCQKFIDFRDISLVIQNKSQVISWSIYTYKQWMVWTYATKRWHNFQIVTLHFCFVVPSPANKIAPPPAAPLGPGCYGTLYNLCPLPFWLT